MHVCIRYVIFGTVAKSSVIAHVTERLCEHSNRSSLVTRDFPQFFTRGITVLFPKLDNPIRQHKACKI